MNRTLLQMLRSTAEENPNNWPKRLPTIMSAYRMTVHRVTQITPNLAMLGREVLFPVTLVAKPPEEPMQTSVPFVRDLRDALRQAHTKVRESTQSVARVEKKYYDERSRKTKFQVGQLVWLYWPKPPVCQKFRKLQQLWTGPWTIESFRTPLVVKLTHTTRRTTQTVHIDRLVPCSSTPSQPVVDDVETTEQVSDDPQPGTSQLFEPSIDGSGESQDVDSQWMTDSTSFSQRPQRTRRRPAALEPYILG